MLDADLSEDDYSNGEDSDGDDSDDAESADRGGGERRRDQRRAARANKAAADRRQRRAFIQEVEAMKRLRGPHTVHIYGGITTYPGVHCGGIVPASNLFFLWQAFFFLHERKGGGRKSGTRFEVAEV